MYSIMLMGVKRKAKGARNLNTVRTLRLRPWAFGPYIRIRESSVPKRLAA